VNDTNKLAGWPPALPQTRQRPGFLLVGGPGLFWIVLFLLVPLGAILFTSFLSRGDYGQIQSPLTLANYKRLLGFGELGFDWLYPQIIFRSLALAAATVLLCLAAGLPLAFFIARLSRRWKNVGLTLVVIPFWTNLLIRTYAWQILFAPESVLSNFAAACGFIPREAGLYPGLFAVLVGLVCDYLPFLVLPLYASVEKIDWTLAEAAADLGANSFNVFRHALLPQIRPGLTAGAILVFLPATGQFVIPDLLGGAKTALLGNAIQQQFSQSRDWPFGSAIACVAIVWLVLGLWLYQRTANKSGEEVVL
jgi:spermidine/putrescine transport system permease protein